jgi:hypothetical protein
MEQPRIPVYNFVKYIKSDKLVICSSGDWHEGVRGVDIKEITNDLCEVNDKYDGDVFYTFNGDLNENNTEGSPGHHFDISEPDPDKQVERVEEALTAVTQHIYGISWNNLKLPKNLENSKELLLSAVSVDGNHEYRTRRSTGIWLSKKYSDVSKVAWLGQRAIINLEIRNKKAKLSKTYKIFLSHWPCKAQSGAIPTILRNFRNLQSEHPGVDIFICGHYHKRLIHPSGYFDSSIKKFRKVLYVVNPSPMSNVEYSDQANFPAIQNNSYVEIFLPIENNKNPYGVV